MANDAPTWYVEQWKDGVLHVYQSRGFTLKNVTTPPVRISGSKMHFLVAGRGEAEEDVERGDVAVPMNGARTKIEVETSKSRAFDEVYEDDLDQMNVDERQVVQETSAMALGRVHDKTLIRAMQAGATLEVGSYTAPITPVTLMLAKQKLQSGAVPVADGQVFAAVDSVAWGVLTTYDQFVNSDYVGPMLPYVNGNLAKTWNGINVFCVDDELFEISGVNSNNFMWHRSSLGFGFTREVTGTVAWDNRKDCWTHNMRMRIGAKVLKAPGIVRMKNDYDPTHITIS